MPLLATSPQEVLRGGGVRLTSLASCQHGSLRCTSASSEAKAGSLQASA